MADSTERLLRDVLQVLHVEFSWTEEQLGSMVAALNAHSKAQRRGIGQTAAPEEVKSKDGQQSQQGATPDIESVFDVTTPGNNGEDTDAPDPA